MSLTMADEEKDKTGEVEDSEQQQIDDTIKDEEKTYTSEQFSGLLRDKQTSDTARQEAQAEAAAARQANEELQRKLEQAEKPKDEGLDEETADEPVLQRDLHAFGKKLVDTITKAVGEQSQRSQSANLKKEQAQNARNLLKTQTVKTAGVGLDAMSVISEGTAYLRQHYPKLLEAAMGEPDGAQQIYELSTALVPDIKKRMDIKRNSSLAKQLDETGNPLPPGSGGGGGGEEEAVLMSIMDGSMPEVEVDKLMGRV